MRVRLLTLVMMVGSAGGVHADDSRASRHEDTRWEPISGTVGYRSHGSGDPEAEPGATLTIESLGTVRAAFGGAIAALDVARYRGKEVELSALIEVVEGTGTAAVWIRADGEGRPPAFATSAADPVRAGAATTRRVRLYVPADSHHLVLGAIVEGDAHAQVDALTVKVVPSAETDVSAFAVLEAAFALVEEHALTVANVDLAALRQQLLTAGLHQAPPPEAYSALARLLIALDDKHSRVFPPAGAAILRSTGAASENLEFRRIDRVGYIAVPGFNGTDTKHSNRFAREICHAITQLAPAASAGWVVDLRRNTGGNMWPMLGGLKPLLGTGSPGAFRDRDGRDTPWEIKAIEGCEVTIPPEVRIAVLIGPHTASAGEAVAVAFSGKPNLLSFGLPTAGLSTANSAFSLPDGGILALTTAIEIDRAGNAFPAGVSPDVQVAQEGPDDEALKAALAWLGG